MTSCNQEVTSSEVLIPPKEYSPYEDYWSQADNGCRCCDWDISTPEDDPEAESKKILQEIETISEEIKESEFYTELIKQINSAEFQSQLTRVRSSHESDYKVPMVIYSLGSLKKSTRSRHQLALALLLQKDLMSDWMSDGPIQVYDPKLFKSDKMVLEELGCTVLSVNEKCRRRVDKPTLFFMPCPIVHLVPNLLEANWSPSNINHVILLTNKMSGDLENYKFLLEEGYELERPLIVDDVDDDGGGDHPITLTERMEYLEAIQKCIEEIKIKGNFSDIYLNDLKDVTDNFDLLNRFCELPYMERMRYEEAIANYTQEIEIPSFADLCDEFCFHLFNVAPEIDMHTLLPDEEELQLKFRSQFDKLPKLEERETIDLFEASILEALRTQMDIAESAL